MGFVHHMLFYALYLTLTEFLNTLKEAQLYRNETCQEKHFSLRKMCNLLYKWYSYYTLGKKINFLNISMLKITAQLAVSF